MTELIEKILNGKKLNYESLNKLMKPYIKKKNIQKMTNINIFIDFNNIVKQLYNPDILNYLNTLKNEDRFIISSEILNLISHYRHYFASRFCCYTTFYFMYNSKPDKNLIKINPDYKKEFYEKRLNMENESFGVLNTIIKENIKIIKTFIKYIPHSYFIDSNNIEFYGIFNSLLETRIDENEFNIIISNDSEFYQELVNNNTMILQLKGERSRIVSSENLFETILHDSKSKTFNETIFLTAEAMTTIDAIISHKPLGIKSPKNFSNISAIKLIQKIINETDRTLDFEISNENDLKEFFEGYLKDEEIEKAIVNMKLTNNHLISSNDSLEAIINSQIVDLVSKDVKKINERYFQKYPLLLDFMFED